MERNSFLGKEFYESFFIVKVEDDLVEIIPLKKIKGKKV